MVNNLKKYLSPLIVQSVISAIVLLLVPLLLIKVNHTSTEIIQKKQQLTQLQVDLDSLDRLQEDKLTTKKQLDRIMASLPNSYRQVADYTIQLEQLTSENKQILETAIDSASAEEKNGLKSLKYTIQTQGTYTTYSSLLNDLARLPYHTRIDSLTIDNNSGQLSTLTTYKIYLLKE